MGGTAGRLSRRSFVAAGAVGVGALALRPRRTIADVLDPSSPAGLWGVARSDEGLLALWSMDGRPVVVRLSDRGPVRIERVLATPPPGVAVALAAGGQADVLGAVEEVVAARRSLRTDHLPEAIRAALLAEVDGPLSVADLVVDRVLGRTPVVRRLDGSVSDVPVPTVPGGVAAAVLHGGGSVWSAVQHPASPEGDHCSALSLFLDGRRVLEIDDLGSAGPAVLAGPVGAPLVSVADGDGAVRGWLLAPEPRAVVAPGAPDEVAMHVSDGRPVALLASPDGATLLGLSSSGWEVLRDVAGTAGCRRVVAIAGHEAAFLVEVADGVRLVDGAGELR